MGAPLTPTEPFAEVALLASYLQVSIDGDDAMALAALEGATALIQSYCDQMITLVEDDTVVLDGTGTEVLLLPEFPVTDVSEVITGNDLDSPTTLLGPDEGTSAEYAWTPSGMIVRRHAFIVSSGSGWGTSYQSISVTYSHGYEQIPADIQNICAAVAARAFAQDGATNESVGSYSASYAGQPGVLTADEKRVLDRYRARRK